VIAGDNIAGADDRSADVVVAGAAIDLHAHGAIGAGVHGVHGVHGVQPVPVGADVVAMDGVVHGAGAVDQDLAGGVAGDDVALGPRRAAHVVVMGAVVDVDAGVAVADSLLARLVHANVVADDVVLRGTERHQAQVVRQGNIDRRAVDVYAVGE